MGLGRSNLFFSKRGVRPLLPLGLVNKLSSIFGWLRLRLAGSAPLEPFPFGPLTGSAKLGVPTSRPAFCFLASLVLAGAKTKPNFFTSPETIGAYTDSV